MPSLLASMRHARGPGPIGHGPSADGTDRVLVGSILWKRHGEIVVFRVPELVLDTNALCRAIAHEATKYVHLWELRLAILRVALMHGAEAEIFADNAQDWREPTHVTLRPRTGGRVPRRPR